jgi:hypothetical protein
MRCLCAKSINCDDFREATSTESGEKQKPHNGTHCGALLYLRAGDRTRTGDVQLGKLDATVSGRFLGIPPDHLLRGETIPARSDRIR